MEQHIQAGLLMADVHKETETMMEAVDVMEGRFPGVTREHLILLWIGVNAARQV